jgi:hypothetical protein
MIVVTLNNVLTLSRHLPVVFFVILFTDDLASPTVAQDIYCLIIR